MYYFFETEFRKASFLSFSLFGFNRIAISLLPPGLKETMMTVFTADRSSDEQVRTLNPEGPQAQAQALKLEGLSPHRTSSTLLLIAARKGHLEECTALLDAGAAQAPNFMRAYPLHAAAAAGHVEVCLLLLDRGAKVDERTRTGNTALHLAATFAHDEVCRLLLRRRASALVKNEKDQTPLMELLRSFDSKQKVRYEAVCRTLLGGLADVNTRDWTTGHTALHVAASIEETTTICEILVDAGGDVHSASATRYRTTPLHLAVGNNHLDTAFLLITRGRGRQGRGRPCAIVDAFGETPLHVAASRGLAGMCEMLLQQQHSHGEQDHLLCMTDVYGNTPLHLAAASGCEDTCRMLLLFNPLSSRAELEVRNRSGDTPLHIASSSHHPAICKLLLECGALCVPDQYGATPLWVAVRAGVGRDAAETCCILLEHGGGSPNEGRAGVGSGADADADADAGPDGGGFTLLHEAVASRNVELCRVFLDHGAFVDGLPGSYWTQPSPLQIAISQQVDDPFCPRMLTIIELLLERGAVCTSDIMEMVGETLDESLLRLFLHEGQPISPRMRKELVKSLHTVIDACCGETGEAEEEEEEQGGEVAGADTGGIRRGQRKRSRRSGLERVHADEKEEAAAAAAYDDKTELQFSYSECPSGHNGSPSPTRYRR